MMDAWCQAKLLSMACQAGQVLRCDQFTSAVTCEFEMCFYYRFHFALWDAGRFKKTHEEGKHKNCGILFSTGL
jgi:hypothetical protein